MEGNLCFKNNLPSLIVKGNLLVLLCFTLYLRTIAKYKPTGGNLTEDFFTLRVWGAYMNLERLIFETL